MDAAYIDPRLSQHAVNSQGKWVGSVAKILSVNEVQAKWGKPALKTGDAYYRVKTLAFLDENEAAGDTNIHVSVEKAGVPVRPARVWHAWPTSRMGQSNWDGAFDCGDHGEGLVFTYANGEGAIGQGGNHGFNPAPGSTTPGCYMVGAYGLPTEVVYGLDLPANRHVAYVIVFEEVTYGETVPETPDPDEPEEPGGTVDMSALLDKLAAAARAFADELEA